MTAIAKDKNQTFRTLRVLFTDAERLELGKQLAEAHNETAQIESDFQRIKDEFKSKLSAVSAKITDLANKVSSGYEMRQVLCLVVFDTPKPGKKQVVRLDGPTEGVREVVETHDMTEAEKTPELALNLSGDAAADLPNTVLPAGTGIATDGTVKVEADGPAQPGDGKN
jgi:hypothetical protein